MKNTAITRLMLGAALVVSVTACGTAKEARVVANSARSAVVSTRVQLLAFKKTRERVAKLEVERVTLFAKQGAEADFELMEIIEEKERNRPKQAAIFKKVIKIAAEIAAKEKARDAVTETTRKRIMDGSKELELPLASLKSLSGKLEILAKEESLIERGKFLIAFAKSVKDGIDKAKEAEGKAIGKMSDSNAKAKK